ncbi:MAG: pirin family protein [Cyanobacteria bacterium P01_D01_bin.123]
MIVIRKSEERGRANHGWLDSYHTFSFANYYDPAFMGFRSLRVINQDRVEGGKGFGTHHHRDMEIISYVLAGELEHKDSMGNGSIMRPGDVQRMTAGTGVAHSEYNHSRTEPVRFLQIWIQPDRLGLDPGYEQIRFEDDDKRNRLRTIASRDGREGSVSVHQDVTLYASVLDAGKQVEHALASDRHAWIQVVRGQLDLNGITLKAGDGAAIAEQEKLALSAIDEAEFLLFDLA